MDRSREVTPSDSSNPPLLLSTAFPRAPKRYSLRSRFVHVVRVLPHGAGRPSAPAGRRSCVAAGRRKLPRCGAFSWLAWTARRARPGRTGEGLLDVALSPDKGCTTYPPALEPLESCSPHAPSGARSAGALHASRPTVARPGALRAPHVRSGHHGFLFCKCMPLPLTRAPPRVRLVAHLQNSPSTFASQVRKAKQS
jgi:hypothetical protein